MNYTNLNSEFTYILNIQVVWNHKKIMLSRLGPVTLTSCMFSMFNVIFGLQVDWEELEHKLGKLERDCKSSWDHLRAIAKHEGGSTSNLKSK